MKVLKYTVEVSDFPQVFPMPMGARTLFVGPSGRVGAVNLWVLGDLDRPTENRSFLVYGTGHNVGPDTTYLGTVPYLARYHDELNGDLVWHLFEVT
jgi:hypothetical protein